MNKDVRWRQRFENFDRAFILLQSPLKDKKLDEFSDLEQEGLIQRFEYTFELSWKMMKDYLDENGLVIDPITPRTVIKEAFAAKIISDGQVWIDMMLHRNLLSHTYDLKTFRTVLEAVIKNYLAAFDALHKWFLARIGEI